MNFCLASTDQGILSGEVSSSYGTEIGHTGAWMEMETPVCTHQQSSGSILQNITVTSFIFHNLHYILKWNVLYCYNFQVGIAF
jgi:hypothetical protein